VRVLWIGSLAVLAFYYADAMLRGKV
jgi:hypothetical protein